MSEVKAWCRYAATDPIMPKDKGEFTGYMIAKFKVDLVVSGKLAFQPPEGQETIVTLKGEMPSLSAMFSYLLRFRRVPQNKRGDYDTDDTYELLPKAGFVSLERIPWTRTQLIWAICNEVKGILPFKARAFAERVIPEPPVPDGELPEGRMQKLDPVLFEKLLNKSEYYRLEMVVLMRLGWNKKLGEIRALESEKLKLCTDHLKKTPWELCFYKHSHEYDLGELNMTGFTAIVEHLQIQVTPVIYAAVRLYDFIKGQKIRHGHTLFNEEQTLAQFKQHQSTPQHVASVAKAAQMWLARNEYLVFINEQGQTVRDPAKWFPQEGEPKIKDMQLPSDEQIKMRIMGHLRRIHANFLAGKGNFTLRPPGEDDPVCAVPKGALNTKQRTVIDHALNNWLTIVQGAPGSGKTAVAITHVATIWHWLEVLTHVGRQASAICDLLGGHTDNARTIHSNYHRLQKSALLQEYASNKEVLILDEVYNADDWTFEKALAAAPEASRLILVGDPDQIRPIPDEKGAGTPALDISRAFPQHVIYLDENMRQRDDARQIYSVVTSVRKKQPDAIEWGRDIADPKQAVVILIPVGGPSGMLAEITKLIHRLRSDLRPNEIGTGKEHSWQLITFYNGTDPDKQGDGVDQLNGHVETFLERSGFFTAGGVRRKKHKVTARLTMYEGFKFMFTAKFLANTAELKKKHQTKDHVYSEVFNGQIEVVKEISQLRLSKVKGVVWEVICYPRSSAPGARGTRFLIHRGLHVDPSKIVSAWAVTSNKSMGGECENVGVFVPPGIEKSLFDRSNVYVAFSRPTKFLGVIGQPRDIKAMILNDPRPIRSGLFAMLDASEYRDLDGTDRGWKTPPLSECQMAIFVKENMDVYDQTERVAYPVPTPVCKIPWISYMAIKKMQRKKFSLQAIKKIEAGIFERFRARLYGNFPRPVRPTDSLFDAEDQEPQGSGGGDGGEMPVIEDPNALLMLILARGAYTPGKVGQEDEEEEEGDGPPRVEILSDEEQDKEEDEEDGFDLPPSPDELRSMFGMQTTEWPSAFESPSGKKRDRVTQEEEEEEEDDEGKKIKLDCD